jgi:hypothetical protein
MVYPFVFASNEQGYELNAGRLPASSYSYNAEAEVGGVIVKAKGKFNIEKTSPEGIDLVANHHLLHQIANQADGLFISKDSLQLISAWLEKEKTITSIAHFSESYQPIINYVWAFLLVVLLLTAEWLLRKMNGSY